MADTVSDGTTTTVFIRLDGHPQFPRTTLEEITRPWVNGVALRKKGNKGIPFTMRGFTNAANAAAANGAAQTLAGYVGKVGTLVYQGVTYIDMAILDVRVVERRTVININGGVVTNGLHLIDVEIDFVYAGV